jgi:hypothetical protein
MKTEKEQDKRLEIAVKMYLMLLERYKDHLYDEDDLRQEAIEEAHQLMLANYLRVSEEESEYKLVLKTGDQK